MKGLKPFTLNFGPQYTAVHGVLRLILTLDGEVIIDADLHSGIITARQALRHEFSGSLLLRKVGFDWALPKCQFYNLYFKLTSQSKYVRNILYLLFLVTGFYLLLDFISVQYLYFIDLGDINLALVLDLSGQGLGKDECKKIKTRVLTTKQVAELLEERPAVRIPPTVNATAASKIHKGWETINMEQERETEARHAKMVVDGKKPRGELGASNDFYERRELLFSFSRFREVQSSKNNYFCGKQKLSKETAPYNSQYPFKNGVFVRYPGIFKKGVNGGCTLNIIGKSCNAAGLGVKISVYQEAIKDDSKETLSEGPEIPNDTGKFSSGEEAGSPPGDEPPVMPQDTGSLSFWRKFTKLLLSLGKFTITFWGSLNPMLANAILFLLIALVVFLVCYMGRRLYLTWCGKNKTSETPPQKDKKYVK